MNTTTIQDGTKTFEALSTIVKGRWKDDKETVVYIEGDWLLCNIIGRHSKVGRRVHTHKGYLKYIRMYGKRYYIDNACVIR